jgi:hypothetical protein
MTKVTVVRTHVIACPVKVPQPDGSLDWCSAGFTSCESLGTHLVKRAEKCKDHKAQLDSYTQLGYIKPEVRYPSVSKEAINKCFLIQPRDRFHPAAFSGRNIDLSKTQQPRDTTPRLSGDQYWYVDHSGCLRAPR